jgi:hypothetical protein
MEKLDGKQENGSGFAMSSIYSLTQHYLQMVGHCISLLICLEVKAGWIFGVLICVLDNGEIQ